MAVLTSGHHRAIRADADGADVVCVVTALALNNPAICLGYISASKIRTGKAIQ
jgi:hypothetical protein